MSACGGNTEKQTAMLNLEETASTAMLNLEETASTDIADLTLENAEFAHYLSATTDNTYLTPIEKTNTMYTAKTGKCYVSLTFTITNKDRGGSISFADPFVSVGDWAPKWNVKYKDEDYTVYGFNLNSDNYPFNLSSSCVIDKETGEAKRHDSSNYLLDSGETVTLRTFGIIDVDPESLKDGFELSVQVPNSDGKNETFTYSIPAKE